MIIIYCPKCDKWMELAYSEHLNGIVCEQICECEECGITYEFSYGAEHFLDENGEEIEIN